jgi:hypothetical protein
MSNLYSSLLGQNAGYDEEMGGVRRRRAPALRAFRAPARSRPRRKLSAYNKFVSQWMRKGYSMQEVADKWNRRR